VRAAQRVEDARKRAGAASLRVTAGIVLVVVLILALTGRV
jgi:hypothetical protein